MSQSEVPAGERGVIRVFSLTADPETADEGMLAAALGVARLDMSGVEVIRLADLRGVGLNGYLTEGLGVAPETVADGMLDGLGAAAVIVHSGAFGGRPERLDVRPPLELAGIYREETGAPASAVPLRAESALSGSGLAGEATGGGVMPHWLLPAIVALIALVVLGALWAALG